MLVRTLIVVALWLVTNSSQGAIYKCETDGQTTYTDSPCADADARDAARIDNSPEIAIGRQNAIAPPAYRPEQHPAPADSYRRAEASAKIEAKAAESRLRQTYSEMALRGQLARGMNKAQARQVLGKPVRVNSRSSARGTSEQWVYESPGGGRKYVYVDNGKVTSVSSYGNEQAQARARSAAE